MKTAARCFRWLAMVGLALLLPALAMAEDDPPGRVGRLADMQGSVSWFDGEQGAWTPAMRNRPLTTGDRLSTDGDARAEVRIGSITLRLGGGSEVEILRLDDDRVRLQLHAGSLAVRVRDREVANELEIVTAEARLRPLRSGHFRVDRIDDNTYAAAWRGELRVDDSDEPFTVEPGRRAELWREGRTLRRAWTPVPDDEFADWVAREDRRDERSTANRYVSPEMTGAEALDRHGRWEQHPEYGALWTPISVQPGWAPYRYGHWAWVRPWGWTWIDDAPWGFAPFHYGRWVYWRDRWAWTPGAYAARPVYAPALVAWVGGPSISVGISIGGPTVGWVPLAPRDVFVPYYRSTPRYVDRINHHRPGRDPVPQVPTGPIMYGNQGVPNAVTVVPRDVLLNRQPVSRGVVDLREPIRGPLPVLREAPPPAAGLPVVPVGRPVPPPPMRTPAVRPPRDVVAVPGGAEPERPPQRDAQPVPLPSPAVPHSPSRDSDGRPVGRERLFDRDAQPVPRAAERPPVIDLRRQREAERAAQAPQSAQAPQPVQPVQPTQPAPPPPPAQPPRALQPVQPVQQQPQQREEPRMRIPRGEAEDRRGQEGRGPRSEGREQLR